jgi:phage pi2 protein 07
MGIFDSGHGDDNNPDVLAYMQQQAEWWLEEDAEMKARKQAAVQVVSERLLTQASSVPRIRCQNGGIVHDDGSVPS